MKTCPYCGLQNDDTASQCETCHKPLGTTSPSAATTAKAAYAISPQESRLWERMTFRQFALLFIRLQAIWLIIDAVLQATYLPRYINSWLIGSRYSTINSTLSHDLALATLRVALYAGGALLVLQRAEQVLSWLVKDWVAQQPLDPARQPTTAPGSPPGSGTTGAGSRGSV